MDILLEPFLEVGKHLGMQGLLLLYIVWQSRLNSQDQDAQRKAHQKEREEWKNEDKRRQEQLIAVIKETNMVDSDVAKELSIIKSRCKGQ